MRSLPPPQMMIEIAVGSQFGAWTTTGSVYRDREKRKTRVPCRCVCGKTRDVQAKDLRKGISASCGCIGNKIAAAKRTTHGLTPRGPQPPEYHCWASMIQRCTNPSAVAYPYYGGRGISVCDRWRNSYTDFLADVGPRPGPAYSLDRYPDMNSNYEPGNIRWATKAEQSSNTRQVRQVVLNGERMCLTYAAKRLGKSPSAIFTRVREHGGTHQQAIDHYAALSAEICT